MKRILLAILALSLLSAACNATPSLWGTYATPTPRSNAEAALIPANPPTFAPTPISEPVAAIQTPTPTLEPLVTQPPPTQYVRPTATKTPLPRPAGPPVLYYSQSGDTLDAVAIHFGVMPDEITSSEAVPRTGLLDPGTLLVIPDTLEEVGPNVQIMPDSEVVYSAAALDFNVSAFVAEAGGALYRNNEYLGSTGWTNGAEAIERLAVENSINPKLLLGILQYEGNWVTGEPQDYLHTEYPMGYDNQFYKGVFRQMTWAVNQLFIGYYGWRGGTLTELTFPDGEKLRLAPDLNAGSVAIQYLFSKLHNRADWQRIIDPNIGFPARYTEMFGDPWIRAQAIEPLFPAGLAQPELVLPFEPRREWNFTGGPHGAWEHDGPLAAIDFAPSTDKSGCVESEKWIVASAPGLVVRSGGGVVVLDLDGDGYEETGWNLLYLHVATKDRVELNTWLETDDRIGHASCEGGVSTGTHLHFARKYNGEWVLADGPLPFNLSGYVVHNGKLPYEGTLTRGDTVIVADQVGTAKSLIYRDPDE